MDLVASIAVRQRIAFSNMYLFSSNLTNFEHIEVIFTLSNLFLITPHKCRCRWSRVLLCIRVTVGGTFPKLYSTYSTSGQIVSTVLKLVLPVADLHLLQEAVLSSWVWNTAIRLLLVGILQPLPLSHYIIRDGQSTRDNVPLKNVKLYFSNLLLLESWHNISVSIIDKIKEKADFT
jgi:hypothetical protein